MDGVVTVSICWKDSKRVWVLSHDFRVAPGGFNLESSTAFVEPGTPFIALVVFELELFVTPDERGTSLQARIESGFKNVRTRE